MYLKHFGFKRKPFSAHPDPRELFQTRAHQEAKARLKIAFDDRVPALIVGDSGVGKSTSMRAALTDLDKRSHRIIEIPDPRLKLRGFYRTIAVGLGLEPCYQFADLSDQVREALVANAERGGRHPILVIDEAQLIGDDALDTLRLLTNPLFRQKEAGLTLLLVGDSTLRRRLNRPSFESFVSRLRMRYHMPPVDDDEVKRYIAHRIRIAGGDPDVFDPDAVDELLPATNGRLRKIDEHCNNALYAAFIGKAKVVSRDHVTTVLAEDVFAT